MLLLGIRTLAGTGGVAVAVDAVSLQGLELSEIKHGCELRGKTGPALLFYSSRRNKGQKKTKTKIGEVWIVLHRKHEHARAREHESTSMSTLARARARGGLPTRQQNSERHAQPSGHLFNLYAGLHGSGWLYMLGMFPHGYLPFSRL